VAPSRRCLTLCFVLAGTQITPAACLTESLPALLALVITAWTVLNLLVETVALTSRSSASPRWHTG
jgi:hypothetical protein